MRFLYKFRRQSQNVTRKAAKKDVRMKKPREKTLMKLTANVINFKILSITVNTYVNSIWLHVRRNFMPRFEKTRLVAS